MKNPGKKSLVAALLIPAFIFASCAAEDPAVEEEVEVENDVDVVIDEEPEEDEIEIPAEEERIERLPEEDEVSESEEWDDGRIMMDAIRKEDPELCEEIESESLRERCVTRASR